MSAPVTDEFWALMSATPQETAEALGRPYESVLEACARGDIPAERWGRRWTVKVQSLRRQLLGDT